MERVPSSCPSCGSALHPPIPDNCGSCGKPLDLESKERSEVHPIRFSKADDDLLDKLAGVLFTKPDIGGTIQLSLRLLERAIVDDEEGRRLRAHLEDIVRTVWGEEADLQYAWNKALDLQKKRGPKPREEK